MVHVATSAGPVLLTSDVMHYYEEYERDYPLALTADVPRANAAFDVIRQLERPTASRISSPAPTQRCSATSRPRRPARSRV